MILSGCSTTDVSGDRTAEFTSVKTVKELASCISDNSDKRSFNGMRIETVEKPTRGNITTLALVNSASYIDLIPSNQVVHIVYRGEATNTPWGRMTNRTGEVTSDIKNCL